MRDDRKAVRQRVLLVLDLGQLQLLGRRRNCGGKKQNDSKGGEATSSQSTSHRGLVSCGNCGQSRSIAYAAQFCGRFFCRISRVGCSVDVCSLEWMAQQGVVHDVEPHWILSSRRLCRCACVCGGADPCSASA